MRRMRRRLIVCADGTWNIAEAPCPTNVVLMARSIRPVAADGVPQFVLYHPGVGTGPFLDRWTGGAFGEGLSNNVKDIYRLLVYNYAPGDEIFLFGFSRGAYTARSAVGLIRKCGLLLKEHADRLNDAYALYRRRDDDVDGLEAKAFRAQYSQPSIEIAFLGVWDTVGALGIPLAGLRFARTKYQFHDVALSRIVRRAYHAVAIDERRKSFAPSLWEGAPAPGQVVDQVWFAGVHSDVGGGYAQHALSDIPFLWMQQKAVEAGVDFDVRYVETHVGPDYRGPIHNSLTGLFRLLGRRVRAMGKDVGHREAVDSAPVLRLLDASISYAPPNLTAYLRSSASVIAEAESMTEDQRQELRDRFGGSPAGSASQNA